MSIGYHLDFMDRIIERADKRQERMEKMINKMLDKSEAILQAGKPQEQTNEEWFCGLSTEEKAEFLAKKCCEISCKFFLGEAEEIFSGYWLKWLKQPHHEKE